MLTDTERKLLQIIWSMYRDFEPHHIYMPDLLRYSQRRERQVLKALDSLAASKHIEWDRHLKTVRFIRTEEETPTFRYDWLD
jgi:hypothetical protein